MPGQFSTGDTSLTTNNLQTTQILTTVGPAALFPAAGAGVRNYLTSLLVQSNNATAPGIMQVLDGATPIFQFALPASQATPVPITFPTPLRGSPNTAMNINAVTTAASVLINAQGYSDGK